MQQAVHQRPARIAGTRVHDQAGTLVHHQQVIILVNHVQTNGLRGRPDLDVRSRLQRDGFATRDRITGAFGTALDSDRAGQQPLFESASRIIGKHPGQRLVQSKTGQLFRDRQYLFLRVHDCRAVYGILADLERPDHLKL